tara:strand:+ start:195 stop:4109 length:3915 start_codon:yes stop_codon:yes gene_type:complete
MDEETDGSAFTGSPESFIQLKSTNFQNSYPEGITEVWRGMEKPSSSLLNDVPVSVVDGDGSKMIKGTGVFTGDKGLAERYVGEFENSPLYHLAMRNSDNSIDIPGAASHWTDIRNPYMQSKESLIKRYEFNLENLEKQYIKNKTFAETHTFNPNSELTKKVHLKQVEDEYKLGKKTLKQLEDAIKNYDNIVSNPRYKELANWWSDPSTRVGGSEDMLDVFTGEMLSSTGNLRSIATDDLGIYLQQSGLDNIRIPNITDGGRGDVFINNQVSGNYLKSLTNNNGYFDLSRPSQFERDGGESLPQAQFGKGLSTILDPYRNLYNSGLDIVKNKIADNVSPWGYSDPFSRLYNAVFTTENTELGRAFVGQRGVTDADIERRDLLHMLMGLDQENNSIKPQTEYTPTRGHNEGNTYYTSPATEEEIQKNLSRIGMNRKDHFLSGRNYNAYQKMKNGSVDPTDEELIVMHNLNTRWDHMSQNYLQDKVNQRLYDLNGHSYNDKHIISNQATAEKEPDKYIYIKDVPLYKDILEGDDYAEWSKSILDQYENKIMIPDLETLLTKTGDDYNNQSGGFYGDVLGDFTLNQGEDEQGKYISYADKWDLSPFKGQGDWKEKLSDFGQKHILGVSPTSIYNRMYYTQDEEGNYIFKKGGSLPKAQIGGETHIVKQNENLGKIAKEYDTTVDELVRLNNITNPNLISVNQKLIVPEFITMGPQPYEEELEEEGVLIHNVKSGDTLWNIAKENKTTTDELIRLNNITNPRNIQINQKIILPNVRQDVEIPKESWHAVDDLKINNDNINELNDENIIINSQLLNNPNQTYIVVDKKTGQLTVRRGDDVDLNFEVLTGKNAGDAQTVTKYRDLNNNGITDDEEIFYKNIDWNAGNKTTGAGQYTINQSNSTSGNYYQNAPSFNLLNDSGIQVGTSIHGTPSSRLRYYNDGNTENNKQTHGCINGKCTDLEALYDLDLPEGTPVFVLPEDEGNYFEIVDGSAALRMDRKNKLEYEGDYEDVRGDLQSGQGGNSSVDNSKYKPIRSKFDKEKFIEDVFTIGDFNDTEELNNTTMPFINALTENKQKIMQEAKINGDVYNQIAKMAFGIYGSESGWGDTHSWIGNVGRGINKKYGDDNSSPDTAKKYKGFNIPFTDTGEGAQSDFQSVGYTQIRWYQLNDDEKKVLRAFNITSNKDFLDPAKSAIATASILAVRYNQQLSASDKKDMWNILPFKWNPGRSNYATRVKDNSKYLDFEQYDVMKVGGEVENNTMYKSFIAGAYEGSKMKKKGQAIFDKLNRIYYKDAKAAGMSAPNYVMSHIVS